MTGFHRKEKETNILSIHPKKTNMKAKMKGVYIHFSCLSAFVPWLFWFHFDAMSCGNVSKILSAQTWWLSFANFQTTDHRLSCFGKQPLLRYTHREWWTCFFAVPQTYTETTSSPKERQGNIPRCTCHLWWVPYHASKQLSKVRQTSLLGTAVYIRVMFRRASS